jgi:putative aminopeptidase FrvX
MDYAFLSNQPEMRNAKTFVGNEKGPVIAIVDSGGQCLIAIRQVVKGLRDTAETGGISCLMETGSGRTTDATAIHRNKGGCLI